MIQFGNGGKLLTPDDPLPELPESIEHLYLDFETGSGDENIDSLNPWRDCFAVGVAVTWDDLPYAFYLPIGHHPDFAYTGNLDRNKVIAWLRELLRRTKVYVNHNIKYDALVMAAPCELRESSWAYGQDMTLGINPLDYEVELVCTVVTAKVLDSDMAYHGGYGLDVLSKQWCGRDISKFEKALQTYLDTGKRKKGKDYSRIAADVMGEYACEDVLSNRILFKLCREKMPAQCMNVWRTEIALTSVLFDMEMTGTAVDETQLTIEKLKTLVELQSMTERLEEILGRHVRPHVSGDCCEVLCGTYGLPVLAYTKDDDGEDTENASFTKHVLPKYYAYANCPTEVLDIFIRYRELYGYYSKFLTPYLAMHVREVLHGNINQAVRTGRMSMSKPNMQQLNKRAKALIIPRKGCAFLSADYSQIEFRFIVHCIQDQNAIEAYKKDPWTDFHTWVAEMCSIPRQAGKTLNFLMGFGGGKAKATKSLSAVKELVTRVKDRINEMVAEGTITEAAIDGTFQQLITQVATSAYETYHRTFPSLKSTSKDCENSCKKRFPRGYIFNFFGRRRYLTPRFAYRAFNAWNQSGAADLIKERMVALHTALQGTPLRMLLQVHDSLLLEGPEHMIRDPRTIRDLIYLMENPPYAKDISVPIKMACGISNISWADADSDDNKIVIDATEYGNFSHLKLDSALAA